MSLTTIAKRAAAALAVAGITAAGMAASAGAASADTANSCSYNSTLQTVAVKIANGGPVQLGIDNNDVVFFDASGEHLCFGPGPATLATKSNTQSISFGGKLGVQDDFIIGIGEPGTGDFNGGAPGGADSSQIEISVLSGSEDTLDIAGSANRDFLAVSGGAGTGQPATVFFNPVKTQPVVRTLFDPGLIRIHGLGGDDVLDGTPARTPAGVPTGGTTVRLDLSGDDGFDILYGGLLAGDRLQGGPGNDMFYTRDGQPGDVVTGGTGIDTASIDPNDQATGVEKFLH